MIRFLRSIPQPIQGVLWYLLLTPLFLAGAIGFVYLMDKAGLLDEAKSQPVECEPQRVTGDKFYWSWRIIDGRQCWYQGRPGKPKSELRWTAEPVRTESRPSGVVEQPAGAPDPGSAASTLTEDDLLSRTCCWPDLEELQRETGIK